jgi:hypothetical protein
MNSFKKLFSILIVGALLLGGFVIKPTPAKAIKNFTVEVSNPRPGGNSDYKFHFSLENKLGVHEFIKFIFPKGFSYKKTITGTVDGKNPDYNVPLITEYPDGSFGFAYNSKIEIDPSKEGYQNIVSTIPKLSQITGNVSGAKYEFRFFNPSKPGYYTFQIYTQSELDPTPSQPIEIKDYPMSCPIISIEPKTVSEPAGYNIDFDLNLFSDLKANEGTIQLQFPPECKQNKDSKLLQPSWVLINDSFLERIPTFQNNILTMTVPRELKSGAHVAIQIDSRVGVLSPTKPGAYELKVMSSVEDKWYRSFPYFVSQEPSPTLLVVEPAMPSEVAEYNIAHPRERIDLKPLETIYVRFPETIKVPSTIDPTSVYVNHKPIFVVTVDGQVVAIQLRSHAKGWMPLEIKMTKEAGIKTPMSKEPFRLELKVEKEGDFYPTNLVDLDHLTLAVMECFTAIWLLKGSFSSYAMDALNEELGPNRVAMINYYVDSTDDHPIPRLSCIESEQRMKWYMEDKGLPNVFFNGTNYIKGIPNLEDDSIDAKRKAMKDEYKKKILTANQVPPPIKISGTCTHVENKTYKISLEVQRIGPIPFDNLQLITALTESNIPYVAINSDTIHYFVLREFLKPHDIKDTTGIPINLAVAGGNFKTEFTFELNTDLYKNELNLIFFVQDMTQRNILQGLTIPIH